MQGVSGLGSIKGNLCVDGIGVFDRRRWIVWAIDERIMSVKIQ